MGKASVPKRGRTAKTRPLRSDSLPRGMPAIVLGKASKKAKLKQTMAKKGKAKLKSAKVKIKTKPVEAEDSDTASVASARVRRSIAPNDSSDNKGSKRQKTSKAPVERSESPATATRLSRSSSSSSLVVKTSEGKKVAKGNTDRGKAKSPTPVPLNKGVQKTTTKEISPTSKGPTAKKSSQTTRKEVENEPSISKKGMTSSLNSSPDTASSCNSQSLLEGSDRADINDDEHDEENYDDEGSFVGSNSEDLDTLTRDQVTSNETIVKSINADEDNQKSIPKLTKKNINELFPSDDSAGKRLRSGSPASQKSTRSLSLHRNSPKSSPASGLRYATRSDSAIRVLRNGKHSKLKQTTLFENMLSDSSKKKRVYSGMLKDEDKIEDSRSDFSDEQSSIFSESDSSSFIDAFTRLKNNDLEDKIDAEDIPGCISNDEEDMMERMTPQLSKPLQPSEPTQSVTEQNSSLGSNQESPLKSTEEPTGTQVVKQDEERNPILASSTGPALKEPLPVSSSQNIMTSATSNSISNVDSEDISEAKECESAASQAPKPNEILNNIQSDWDSDGEGNKEDVWIPKSPKDSRSAFDELVSDSAPPQSQEKGSSDEEKLSEMTGGFPSSDDKQDSVSSSPIPMDSSKCDPLDTSSQQPVNVTSQSVEQSDPANPQAKLPDPIILKTSDKNGFAESVDFVAKKNPRIDFELLRRRTKRSMSFNMDVPEKNQSQRILSVEPNKLSGKTALVWTVKAVREPIIPKSSKSPDKSKCDSQENRNVSSVKPMMESTQNDHLSTIPKVPQETVVSTVPFPVSSSSIKENILVQTAPKQNSGKSPAREAREATSATSSTPKPVIMSPTAKPNSDLKKDNVICKPSQTSADSALAATLKPSLGPSSPVHNSEMTLKAATVASPFSNILVSSASSVGLSNDVSVATAVQTPIGESMTENDPLAPCLASDQASKADEAAIDRCMTPNHQSTPHKSIEITPEKLSVDDGESFCLRLSPTPTKEEVCDHSTVTPVKEHLKADDKLIPTGVIDDKLLPTGVNEDKLLPTGVTEDKLSPTGVAEDTLLPAGVMQESCEPKPDEQKEKDNESLSDIRQELEEKLPVEIQEMGQTSVEEGHDNYEVLTKADTQTLQLVRRKGPSSGRPRSRSADFNPTSLAFGHEDIWIVKNDVHSIRLERRGSLGMARTLSEETSDGNFGETKENVPELSQSDKIDSDPRENNTETQAGTPSLKSDEKNDSSSSMTVECPDVRVKQPGLLSPRLEADVERLHLQLNDIEKKRREITEEEQSPEKKAIKEWILSSLGLQSVAAAAAAAASSSSGRPSKRRSQDGLAPSSGRLKAVIKIPKDNKRDKKSDRKPLRMVFKNGKPYPGGFEDALMGRNVEADSTVGLEGNSSDVSSSTPMLNESDHGANSSILLSDLPASLQGAEADGKGKPAANLIIPEKSSSFSIHPGRLCSDVCSYCFGKFGSLDTPCHVAQLKSRERQMKIMSVETHLAMDSCLCDACIRYVDRKANCPSSKPQTSHRKESKSKFEGSMANCSVTACVQPARHSLRKKWYIKIRKSVMKKCPIDLELAHQHLPLPLCPEHFSYMEYFMVCGLCKRRLSRSHMYNLTNTSEINICLEADGIPARLSDKLFVCKLCRYYATLRVKHPGSHFNLSSNQREFFNSYRKRILLSHDIDVSDIEEGNADLEIPNKITNQEDAGSGSGGTSLSISTTSATVAEENLPKGKRRRAGSNATNPVEAEIGEQPRKKSRSVEQSSKAKDKSETGKNVSRARSRDREGVPPITISVAEHMQPTHNKIHKVGKASKSRQESENTSAMEWAHKGLPPFYPGEDELALHGKLQFQFDDEPSANRAWEKCTSTLQFDKDTKKLWQELQRPYGSQSSFLRHLVLMERYWRQGELILAPDASAKATSYTRSVQNRLKAYGSTITMKSTPEPPKPTPSVLPSSLPQSVAPAVTEALTGGTVLTAAAAAAAVTAVHLSSSPAPLQSPSSSGSLKETIPALPPAKVPHPKQQAKPQGKSQQNKSHSLAQVKPQVKPQVKAQGKPQVVQRIQPMLQVASVAPHVVKSPSTMKVSVKTSLPNQEATSPLRQQLAAQVASSVALSVVSISTPMSVTAGVTITAEPNVKPTSQLSHGKLQQILPKPQSSVASKSSPSSSFTLSTRVNTSSWEPTTHTASSRSQFMPISAPVVNLTRSISLTAVPSSPPSVPDLHPINSDGVSITRPSRSPSASLAQNSTSMSVSSRGSSGGFVSIIPTSPNKTVYSKPPSQSLNKPASITPIYTSQSLPSSVTVTASSASTVSSPAVLSTESRAPTAGKVHVTAGGKSFSLTIQQFKKLQALRQQRQQEQQCKRLGAKPGKEKERRERETTITPIPPVNQRDDLEVVEVRDTDSEGQQISFPTISAVCSGDQAKAMWNDESRAPEGDSNTHLSVSPSMVDITQIVGSQPELPVENLPKIPKTLTVTQIRKESSTFTKTVSASGMSLTITRQKCQTPVQPQISSPVLDIFPS